MTPDPTRTKLAVTIVLAIGLVVRLSLLVVGRTTVIDGFYLQNAFLLGRDLEPYRDEVVARGIARRDLSALVTRSRHASARRQSFDEMVDALHLDAGADLRGSRSLLIVDDYFVTGRTAAALLSVLRSHGYPADADVTVACPLWLSKAR